MGPEMRPVLPIGAEAIARFWSLTTKGGGCWEWQGTRVKGRAFYSFDNRTRIAARVAWAITHGSEPTLFVCHTCDNPGCVNPAHLWLGTTRENMLDASRKGRFVNQQKTHCPRGHELTPENMRKIGSTRGSCKECNRTVHKPAWRRKRAMEEGRRPHDPALCEITASTTRGISELRCPTCGREVKYRVGKREVICDGLFTIPRTIMENYK